MTANRISPDPDISCQNLVDLTGDEDPTDEDGDIGVSVSLGDEIFSRGKKSWESDIGGGTIIMENLIIMKNSIIKGNNIITENSIIMENHKLKAWDKVNPDKRVCSLCEGQEDSHEHLFFECSFSKQIWQQVKCYAGLSGSDFSIDNIIQDIIPFAMKRSSKSICAKLVVAAASFFIWQERNNRLFRSEKRSVDNVVACIFNTVRLKLVSFTWKKGLF
ncbi:reverse transcriptase domain, reverse transcriptase zinc-binding domain protein [Tanacetum coccineum]